MFHVASSFLLPFLGPVGPFLGIIGGVLGGFLKTRIGQIMAVIFITAIALYIWDIFDDRKVIAKIERKADIHANKSIDAGRVADSERDPGERLRKHWCRDC